MSAAAEWHRLDDAYYRRTTLYDLAWPVQSLRDELVATSLDGSLVGAWRC